MASKVALQVEKPFNRNLEGVMVVGHPKHPDVKGRVLLLSEASAAVLAGANLAKEISRADYDKAMREAESGSDEPSTGQDAGEVRLVTTAAADGSASTGAGDRAAERASVTMSNANLKVLADKRGVDLTGLKTRADKVRAINGETKQQETDVTALGVVGNLTDGSTNHPANSGPHKAVGADGTVVEPVRVPGTPEIEADEDAAPSGGGGSSE